MILVLLRCISALAVNKNCTFNQVEQNSSKKFAQLGKYGVLFVSTINYQYRERKLQGNTTT